MFASEPSRLTDCSGWGEGGYISLVLRARYLHHISNSHGRRDGRQVDDGSSGGTSSGISSARGPEPLSLHGCRHQAGEQKGSVDVDVEQVFEVGKAGLSNWIECTGGNLNQGQLRPAEQKMNDTFHRRTYTSGVDCVVDTPEDIGRVGDGGPDRLFDTHVDLDGVGLEVGIDSHSLGLSSRLLSPFQIDIGDDQA